MLACESTAPNYNLTILTSFNHCKFPIPQADGSDCILIPDYCGGLWSWVDEANEKSIFFPVSSWHESVTASSWLQPAAYCRTLNGGSQRYVGKIIAQVWRWAEALRLNLTMSIIAIPQVLPWAFPHHLGIQGTLFLVPLWQSRGDLRDYLVDDQKEQTEIFLGRPAMPLNL